MRYAIDALTLLEIVAVERATGADHQLVAPSRLRSDSLQLLLDRVGNGELDDASAMVLHERLTTLKVRALGDRVSRRAAWRLARDRGWRALDDAEYLAVASLQADALVTVDPRLAALARGIVDVANIDVLYA